MNKDKEKMIQAYEKTKEEWTSLGIKEKSIKIKEYFQNLRDSMPEEIKLIDNQILMIEELESEELIIFLNNTHSMIMENALKIINSINN